jgi:hypothetical protein
MTFKKSAQIVHPQQKYKLDQFETMPPFILAVDFSMPGCKRVFVPFETEQERNDFAKSHPELSLHEMLTRNGKTGVYQRMYFDFDAEDKNIGSAIKPMDLFELFISNVVAFLRMQGIENTDYYSLSCHREGKTSFHVIFKTLMVETTHYSCIWENICRAVETDLASEEIDGVAIRKIVDGQVYCANRTMRIIGSGKAKNGKIDEKVGRIVNSETCSPIFDPDALITTTPQVGAELYRCGEFCLCGADTKKSSAPPSQDQMIRAIAEVERLSAAGCGFSLHRHRMAEDIGFINLLSDHSKPCFVCGRKHDSENMFVLVTKSHATICCRRNKNARKEILDFGHQKYESVDNAVESTELRILRTEYEFVKNINEADSTSIYLRSMMKTGKSVAFTKYMLERTAENPDYTCIVITYRTNLAGEICSKNEDFYCYSDIKEQKILLSKYRLIVVQFESLHRLDLDCSVDLCFIDEACSLLSQTQSGLNRVNYVYNTMRLQSILQTSHKFIASDALLDKNTVSAFQCYRKDPSACVWLNNTPVKWGIKMREIVDPTDWRNEVLASVGKGENIYVTVTHGEEWILALERLIKDKYPATRILSIYGGGEQNQEVMSDINAELVKYNVVLASPSMAAGVSFDVKGHFNRIFAYIDNAGPSYVDVVQSLYRVRNPVACECVIYIQCAEFNIPTKLEDVKAFEESKLYFNSLEYIQAGIQLEYAHGSTGMRFRDDNDSRLMFELYARAALNNWRRDIKGDLWRFLGSHGASFELIEKKDLKSDCARIDERHAFKAIKSGVKFDKSTSIASAPLIDNAEYDEIAKLKRLTAEKKAKIEKYRLANTYGRSEVRNEYLKSAGVNVKEGADNINDARWIHVYNEPKIFDMFRHAVDRYATTGQMIAEDEAAKKMYSDAQLVRHEFKSARHKVISDMIAIVNTNNNAKSAVVEYLVGLQAIRHPLVAELTKITPENGIAVANKILSIYGWKIKGTQKRKDGNEWEYEYYVRDILADYFVINLTSGNYLNPLSMEAEFYKPMINMRY